MDEFTFPWNNYYTAGNICEKEKGFQDTLLKQQRAVVPDIWETSKVGYIVILVHSPWVGFQEHLVELVISQSWAGRAENQGLDKG